MFKMYEGNLQDDSIKGTSSYLSKNRNERRFPARVVFISTFHLLKATFWAFKGSWELLKMTFEVVSAFIAAKSWYKRSPERSLKGSIWVWKLGATLRCLWFCSHGAYHLLCDNLNYMPIIKPIKFMCIRLRERKNVCKPWTAVKAFIVELAKCMGIKDRCSGTWGHFASVQQAVGSAPLIPEPNIRPPCTFLHTFWRDPLELYT